MGATTTLKIASQANCSKETLYNWFGDREGLFTAMVEAQTDVMLDGLAKSISRHNDATTKFANYCAAVLDFLTGEAVVLVNRAVISEIGHGFESARHALGERREAMKAIGVELLNAMEQENKLHIGDIDEVYSTLLGLLISDRQIRVLMGGVEARPTGGKWMRLRCWWWSNCASFTIEKSWLGPIARIVALTANGIFHLNKTMLCLKFRAGLKVARVKCFGFLALLVLAKPL